MNTPLTPRESPWYTRKEAADYLRVSVATVDSWARAGRLVRQEADGRPHTVRFHKINLDDALLNRLVQEVIDNG